MKTKKTPVKASSTWRCDTCDDKLEMDHPEMVLHLKEMHGVDAKGLKCKISMRMHLDGSDYFSSTYDVSIALPDNKEIKMTNATCNPRRNDDPMSFG